MTRIDSDYRVTPAMAQRVLDIIEAREGPDFPGWSRTIPGADRKAAFEAFRDTLRIMAREVICPHFAMCIRLEFGVGGELLASKERLKGWD